VTSTNDVSVMTEAETETRSASSALMPAALKAGSMTRLLENASA
jgi:hypothetical protein